MISIDRLSLTNAIIEEAYSYRARLVNAFMRVDRDDLTKFEKILATKVSTVYSSVSCGKTMDNHTTIKIKVEDTSIYIGFEDHEIWFGFTIATGDSPNYAEKIKTQ